MDPSELNFEQSGVRSLYELAGEVVYKQFITFNNYLDLKCLPDPLVYYLLCLPFKSKVQFSNEAWKSTFAEMDWSLWIRLLRYEKYRPTLFTIYQQLTENTSLYDNNVITSFEKRCSKTMNFEETSKMINYGLTLGNFFSEGSWYTDAERILTLTRGLIEKLPQNTYKSEILLECCHRLFYTLTMFFKFDQATKLFEELLSIVDSLKQSGIEKNYALLYTEFSRLSFHSNNYDEAYNWIKKAMECLNDKTSMSTQIQVLRQASRIFVVKHNFVKAEYLIHQALARAEQYYSRTHHKFATLLIDFGFYLLNCDKLKQSVDIYTDALKLRYTTFGQNSNNLHIAIAEEDLAYALYVFEYSKGDFIAAMYHAEKSIRIMKRVLPSKNLMLCSANRVKALILEEQALDIFDYSSDEKKMGMLKETELLHKDALSLTRDIFGEENILTAKHYGNLGRLYQSMKRYKEAEEMHLKAIALKEKMLGTDDYELGLSIGHLASLYNYQTNEYKKAEELYHRSIQINLKLFSETYSGLEYDYQGLMHVYQRMGDEEKYLEYSQKLRTWKALRKNNISNVTGYDLYKNSSVETIEDVVKSFLTSPSSSAEDRCVNEESAPAVELVSIQ